MYLVDANVFIQAKNLHYGMDFHPGFWDWLERAGDASRVMSVQAVYEELLEREDELAQWARRHASLFIDPWEDVMSAFTRVSCWVYANREPQGRFKPAAVNDFLGGADPFLIAHALATGDTVVTHEKAEPDAKKRIPIPNVCEALGVAYKGPFEMLRRENARFVIGADGAPQAASDCAA